jgi:hypothetical protein
MQALAEQAQGGAPIGFANPQIYARYGTPAIQDVTHTPFGPDVNFGVVRNNYSNPQDPNSTISTRLDTFAHDGCSTLSRIRRRHRRRRSQSHWISQLLPRLTPARTGADVRLARSP